METLAETPRVAADPGIEQQLAMLEQMVRIRVFEETVMAEFRKGRMRGSVHMCLGQEAIAVGVCAALDEEDYITSSHRGDGHCLAKGGDPKRMMAELYGKLTGYCKGKGGQMHLAAPEIGHLGSNAIVGGGLGMAAGAALALSLQQKPNVVVTFFGEGAVNQGIFHEAANLCSVWKLPLLFVCENNLYCLTTHYREVTAGESIAARARAYGMPSLELDGNDVLEVYRETKRLVQRARAGAGPAFIEAHTYRYEGHWIGDPLVYRTVQEVEERRAYDPIERLKAHLANDFNDIESRQEGIRENARKEMEGAVRYALESPEPPLDEASTDVWA